MVKRKVRNKPRVDVSVNVTPEVHLQTPIEYDDLPINSRIAKSHRKPVPSQLERPESTIDADIATELNEIMPEIWKVVEEMEPSDRPR